MGILEDKNRALMKELSSRGFVVHAVDDYRYITVTSLPTSQVDQPDPEPANPSSLREQELRERLVKLLLQRDGCADHSLIELDVQYILHGLPKETKDRVPEAIDETGSDFDEFKGTYEKSEPGDSPPLKLDKCPSDLS